jgi:uncharacterized protein (TIGR03083 family)
MSTEGAANASSSRRSSESWRDEFAAAADGFAMLVAEVAPDDWERPGLGVWNVRGLVGHTSRSLTLIGTYLAAAADPSLELYLGPVDYFAGALPSDGKERAQVDAAIAERGRQAGEELGPEPASRIAELAASAVALVRRTPDDAELTLRDGRMSLAGYIPTRTFELAVHSLDLADALGLTVPPRLAPAISAACTLAGALAARGPAAADVLRLLTGRGGATAPSVV